MVFRQTFAAMLEQFPRD